MNNMNNEKNKSSVILNPERSEWVSRSHVTSVESVVNDGVKTKRYSAKRDLYARSPNGSRLKMTTSVSCREAHKRRFLFNSWFLRLRLRMTFSALALIFTLITTAESSAEDLANSGSCGDGCLYQITEENGERNLVVYNVPNYTGTSTNIKSNAFDQKIYGEQANFNKVIIKGDFDTIGGKAFWRNGASEVVFNGKIKDIGYAAFGYNKFTSVDLPEGLQKIGDEAFYGNTLISDITLPEGLEKIGRSAFSHNYNLSSPVIPDTVTDIDSNAFSFINNGDDYLRIDSITLPESLVRTGDYIFNGSGIGEIVIPDTLNTDTWSEKTFFNDSGSYSGITFACKGIMQECQKAMSRFISKTEGGIGTCEGKYCLKPNKISFASASEASCKGERYWYHNGVCQLNPLTTYAKKRWTPAEANEWLKDDNNFVILTFKK